MPMRGYEGTEHPVTSGGTFAIISGEQPHFVPEVSGGHKGLEKLLAGSGYEFEPTTSQHSPHHPQYGFVHSLAAQRPTFIVHDIPRDAAIEIGRKMGQGAIIYSTGGQHEFIYTNGEPAGKYHPATGHTLSPNAPMGAISTQIPGRGHIVFAFDHSKLLDVPKKGSAMSKENPNQEVNVADVKKALAKALRRQIDIFSKTMAELAKQEAKGNDSASVADLKLGPGKDFEVGEGVTVQEFKKALAQTLKNVLAKKELCKEHGAECKPEMHKDMYKEEKPAVPEERKKYWENKRKEDDAADEAKRQEYARKGHDVTIKSSDDDWRSELGKNDEWLHKLGDVPASKSEMFIDDKRAGDRPASTDDAKKGGPRVKDVGLQTEVGAATKPVPGGLDEGSGGQITKGKMGKAEVPATAGPVGEGSGVGASGIGNLSSAEMEKSAPPGWGEATMHKLKAKLGTERAFKIAWSQHKKGIDPKKTEEAMDKGELVPDSDSGTSRDVGDALTDGPGKGDHGNTLPTEKGKDGEGVGSVMTEKKSGGPGGNKAPTEKAKKVDAGSLEMPTNAIPKNGPGGNEAATEPAKKVTKAALVPDSVSGAARKVGDALTDGCVEEGDGAVGNIVTEPAKKAGAGTGGKMVTGKLPKAGASARKQIATEKGKDGEGVGSVLTEKGKDGEGVGSVMKAAPPMAKPPSGKAPTPAAPPQSKAKLPKMPKMGKDEMQVTRPGSPEHYAAGGAAGPSTATTPVGAKTGAASLPPVKPGSSGLELDPKAAAHAFKNRPAALLGTTQPGKLGGVKVPGILHRSEESFDDLKKNLGNCPLCGKEEHPGNCNAS